VSAVTDPEPRRNEPIPPTAIERAIAASAREKRISVAVPRTSQNVPRVAR
jgi:hypothetical protein